jgi:3-dehydroquinate dehydratase-1
LIEWRADALAEVAVDAMAGAARALRSAVGDQTLLFTLRNHAEGGLQPIAQEVRSATIAAIVGTGAVDLIDVELSNGAGFNAPLMEAARRANVRVVMSFHDFEKTPTNDVLLECIVAMISQGADMAKIACMPREQEDVLRLLEVTSIARKRFADVPLCTMAMGALGSISRVAGFLFGSDMAFAVGQAASAPGQIPLSDARKIAESLLSYA